MESRSSLPPAIDIDDRRPAPRRRHESAGPTGDVEFAAARVVSRLTGRTVVIQDDGSAPAMPDLRIDHADGRSAVVEVVVDLDRDFGSVYASLLTVGGQIPMTVEIPSGDRMWWVTLSKTAHVRTLKNQISGALTRAAEALGENVPGKITALRALPDQGVPEIEKLRELGVTELGSRPLATAETAAAHLRPPGIRGPDDVSWDQLLAWVEDYLTGPSTRDVRDKLAKSGATERHAFVAASFTSPWAAYHCLVDGLPGLPSGPPTLPSEVTHLWLWTVPPTGRCLAWFPDRGWLEPRCHWATE